MYARTARAGLHRAVCCDLRFARLRRQRAADDLRGAVSVLIPTQTDGVGVILRLVHIACDNSVSGDAGDGPG